MYFLTCFLIIIKIFKYITLLIQNKLVRKTYIDRKNGKVSFLWIIKKEAIIDMWKQRNEIVILYSVTFWRHQMFLMIIDLRYRHTFCGPIIQSLFRPPCKSHCCSSFDTLPSIACAYYCLFLITALIFYD